MKRLDALTSVALVLVGGALYAAAAIWLAGLLLGAHWPEWYVAWARDKPGVANAVRECVVYFLAFLVPAALLAWLMAQPGRLGDWRYALLAPLPLLLWTIGLPALEGTQLRLAAAFDARPVTTIAELAAVYLGIPVFAWLFRRRPASAPE